MQKEFPPQFIRRSPWLRTTGWLVLACSLITHAYSQSVIVAPPAPPTESKITATTSQTTSDAADGDTNQVDSASGGASVSAGSAFANRNPFQWGPVMLHPRLGYGISYGTGLQTQPGEARKSLINTVSAGFGVDLGKHWDLGYTAGATFYSDPKFKNNVDHNVIVHGHTSYEDWSFNLSQSVGITSDPLIETARQTDQQSYSTSLGMGYQINGDLSAALTAGQQLTASSASGLTNSVGSSTDWTLSGSLNYQIAPSLYLGTGIGLGYTKVAAGLDNTYEDLNLTLSWAFARKFSIALNGGAQIRQSIGSGQSSLISPTFGVTLNYHPFRYTTLYVSASRSIGASYYQFLVTENTSVNVGLSQRLFKKYSLSINASYGESAYLDTRLFTLLGLNTRADTHTSYSVSLSRSFLKRGTAALTYSRSQNSSNSQGFGYNSDQAGMSLSYSY